MALDAIIFDVDGTLVDSNRSAVESFVRAFEACGFQVPADRIAIEIGKGGDNLVPAILGRNAEEKLGGKIRKLQADAYATIVAESGLQVFPGVRELIQAVRNRGLKVVIATSGGKRQIEDTSRASGLDIEKIADVLVTADDAATSKPAPDLVTAAVKKAKLSPAQCAMVGDTPHDAEAAKQAGVVCIGLLCGGMGNSPESLTTAGARVLYNDPADLLAHLDDAVRIASPGSIHLTSERLDELMSIASSAARDGMSAGEVPIGCVIANGDGKIVCRGWNRLNATGNKIMHAEIVAFTEAGRSIPLDCRDLILVSTLEPCVMCTGAAMEAAVDTIIYGLRAPADSGTARVRPPTSPESQMPRIVGDILPDQSLSLLQEWFQKNSQIPQAAYVKKLLAFHHR